MSNASSIMKFESGRSKRPLAIDLFAGAGGMSLGFEQAGFDVVAAVEIDPIHCATHEFNFPETTVIPESVASLSGDDIRKAAGIGGAPIACVFGGPPCQGFSLIGHRVLDDPRNNLVKDFVRIVAELDADTFVFENVKGLTVGKHKAFLEELVYEFEAHGYAVQRPWHVLNADNFGVPQHRERLILLGAKTGRPLPEYPEPSSSPADGKKAVPNLPLGPTCEDAIGDLPNAERFNSLVDSDCVKTSDFREPSLYAAELRCMTNEAWHFGYVRDWDPSILTSSIRTSHTDISRRRFSETVPGTVEPISRFFKLAPDGLSNTLRAGTDGSRGAFTSPRPIHFKHDRCITVREMARLHGFPDWFRFHSTKWHGARQIGNAVPPPLARAVASSILNSIGIEPSRPIRTLKLGNPDLLYLELSKAAAYFDVDTPPSRRDRKSGAKKRKQAEIERERLSGN
jgi:DNA (cytosine-5)-methyltransferase 1